MCKSDQPTISITSTDAELATAMCQDPKRRALILTALTTGACLASSMSSIAEEEGRAVLLRPFPFLRLGLNGIKKSLGR